MKKTAKPQTTKISTVQISFGGVTYSAVATDRLEALSAIAEAAESERAAK